MTTNKTRGDLEKFRDFKSNPSYTNTRPVSKQPALFIVTAKTHKYDDYSLINVNNLKLRPIIDFYS